MELKCCEVAIVIILLSIWRYLSDFDTEVTLAQATSTETNWLLPKDPISRRYGTCEEDLESGKCSGSSEELYDGRICIICYEEQRNCFFIPCGHCATCYVCAQRSMLVGSSYVTKILSTNDLTEITGLRRIMDGDSKTCPVCRRLVHK
ncbi:hypothetical protein RJ639_003343, partial [Escallonia herrerae]